MVPYKLWIDATEPIVEVREFIPDRLPQWCPELHINNGGYFCLGWGKDAPGPVTDTASADRWWSIVLSYLKLQERAAIKRRWPNNNAWAHGDAAQYQSYAEQFAAVISSKLSRALKAGRLTILKKKQFFRLMLDGERLYSIITGDINRAINLRRRCLCGSDHILRNCENHAQMAVGLVQALRGRKYAESLYWESFKHKKCCGRIKGCPLAEKHDVELVAGGAQ